MNGDRLRAFLYRHLMLRFAPRNMRRDIGAVHELLRSSGRAVWLGQSFPMQVPPPLDEMPHCVARVRALLDDCVIPNPQSHASASAVRPGRPRAGYARFAIPRRGERVRSTTTPPV